MATVLCLVLLVFATTIQPFFSQNANRRVKCDESNSILGERTSTSLATMGIHNRPQVIKSNKRGLLVSDFLPCEPWNSCVGRCVESDLKQEHLPPYTCYCDLACVEYRDCCGDYVYACRSQVSNTSLKNRGLVFTCVDLGWDLYGVLMVYRCPISWMGEKFIINGCESTDFKDLAPVSDDTGIVYRNSMCAMCNGVHINNMTRWRNSSWCEKNGSKDPSCTQSFKVPSNVTEDDSFFPRKCFHHVGECTRSAVFETSPQTALGCYAYSGMVTFEDKRGSLTKFKNAHCALCNRIPSELLTCPQWQWMLSYSFPTDSPKSIFMEERIINRAANDVFKVKAVKTQTPTNDIPPSVSILLNFGLNGKKQMLFSSSDSDWMVLNNGKCSDNYIWDPFMQICRKLSCTGNFNLVNFECVETDENDGTGASRSNSQLTQTVMGMEVNTVAIYLSLQVHTVTVDDEEQLALAIEKNLKQVLSSSVGISTDRISNVTVLKNETTANETNGFNPATLLRHNFTGNVAGPSSAQSPTHRDQPDSEVSRVNSMALTEHMNDSHVTSTAPTEHMNNSHVNSTVPTGHMYDSRVNSTAPIGHMNDSQITFTAPTEHINDSDEDSMAPTGHMNDSHVSSTAQTEHKKSVRCVHDAIQNVRNLVFHTRSVNVAFYLTEPESEESFEPSIDRVVSLITSSINLNTLFMVVSDVSVQIRGIHEETVVKDTGEFQDWCLDGDIREYMSNEFDIINNDVVTDDWHMQIHINRTGLDYHKGEFLANFIFQGSQGDGGLTNISGIVVVCENQSRIQDSSCPRLTLNESEYHFLYDKTVVMNENRSTKLTYSWGEYELLPNKDLCVCFKPPLPTGTKYNGTWFTFDLVQAYVNLVLMSISLCATFATLATYTLFSELRNVPGMNLMNLTTMVLVSQLTFLLGMRGSVTGIACRLVAIFIHYAILASFFWSNIMAFDLYKTFGSSSVLPHIRNKLKHARFYSLYAYTCPLIIVAIAVVLDSCNCVDGLMIGYGYHDVCWIGDPVSTAIFFAVPITVLFLVNIGFYVLTIMAIRRITKMTRLTCNQRGGNDVVLYIRMSSVMGFTWIFGLASAFTSEDNTFLFWVKQTLSYLFIIFFASQGLMLFGAFACNKRVSKLYISRMQGLGLFELIKRSHCTKCKKMFGCCCQHTISRSTSVETCRSTVNEYGNI